MSAKFGTVFAKVWPAESTETQQLTEFKTNLLKHDIDVAKPKSITFEELLNNADEFPLEFPINSCRIRAQPEDRKKIIEQHAATAYPIIHERVLWLYLDFLEHKVKYGTSIEKEIYNSMTVTQLIQRLLEKRCAAFFNPDDEYLLISNDRGTGGFSEIGSNNEIAPLLLRNCLSYDEMKLSALLSVSSYTDFINDGNRYNRGVVDTNHDNIEREGVIIGLIGARFEARDLMEFQEIGISRTQNIEQNGYGKHLDTENNATLNRKIDFRKIWSDFYNEPSISFDEVSKLESSRFGKCYNRNDFFDNVLMKKRYTITFDLLLLEAEERGRSANKQVFLHVVVIGLGVWKVCAHQEEVFLDTFEQRLRVLLPKLNHISYIHFAWFHLESWRSLTNNGIINSSSHPDGGIRIFVSNRNPSASIPLEIRQNTLLVVSYAWDGNALPGNEFWMGLLDSSGDPSTACSSLIAELHNPHINKSMVNSTNLHIASATYGVLHFTDYLKKLNFP